ncbi:discoidin domain-containing protein [Chitinophaga nivalis]|uniref:Discoidin domain-containing protein n=1 Tax=Chitinophaga nivalis TaxID=2991709 RepID=A0ABT3IRL2_9BACT|nr:discoidin domain-containing protein [Chitinophaga nivalis]MCW3463695.1 discoidin domain-containing protein [Chitinophaga nivalis]MCW3486615.1 discoidin domain-containing protein [Chitinophaga nivalis]
MKKNPNLLLAGMLLLSTWIGACKKDADSRLQTLSGDPAMALGNLTASAYDLNVVYFVPSDGDTIVNYRARLNGILKQGQRFYGKWMNYYGYGDRSFGLRLDSLGNVKITVVKGALTKAGYPYEGGGNTAINELNTWFAAHPGDKHSEHTLVIMPASTYGADGDPGGVPFYGLGRWCFALDYAEMDTSYLGQSTTLGNRATKWIGGLMHELGHGLNLPHNKEKVSEAADATKGTALMGSGNYTYGKSATFLTAASAAILNNCQVFRTSSGSGFYGGGNTTINTIKANYASGNIALKVRFSATQTVNNVIVYNDPEGGNDYDAVAWVAAPAGDSFQVSMPISELQKKTGNYSLRIRFLYTNGSSTEISYPYTFVNNEPVLDISTKDELNKSAWTITSVSSQEDDGPATNLLDNNQATVWHTQWKSVQPAHPHTVVVNMNTTQQLKGLAFLQRANLNGSLKDITVYTSTDNSTYTSRGNYTLTNVNSKQYVTFTAPVNAKYIKVVTGSNYAGSHYAVLAELGAF